MKFLVELDTANKKTSLATLEEAKLLLAGKAAPADKPAVKGKKSKVVEEEEEEEDEVDFDEEDEESEEEEVEDEDGEEEEGEEDGEEDEYEAPVKKKVTKKAPGKAAPAKGKLDLKAVMAEFQAAHKKLSKKLKSEDKAQAKLNAVLKKNGAASTRKLDPSKFAAVVKELKALAV